MKVIKTLFSNVYQNKTVLITGNTGFKGSWLSIWLDMLGARVYGISDEYATNPNHYNSAGLNNFVQTNYIDICSYEKIHQQINKIKPDFIFHLAAQSLVQKSYKQPLDTFITNSLGTATILEAVRNLNSPCNVVIITSDKCYENVETYYGYRETDTLGGIDPYSASKAAAEIIFSSYARSFFTQRDISIASARAGNVIGGGDWSEDRLIPDIIKAWKASNSLEVRNPNSVRPWQHVLEPLSGYLYLGMQLTKNSEISGESFNFGPTNSSLSSVIEVVNEFAAYLVGLPHWISTPLCDNNESNLLKLNCDKANSILKWQGILTLNEAINLTANWYIAFYEIQEDSTKIDKSNSILELSKDQIKLYSEKALDKKVNWAIEN